MPLTRYGLREWLAITIVLAAVAIALAWFTWWWMAIPIVVAWAAIVSFFRDPIRRIPVVPEGVFLSPADGTVSAVERLEHHDATDGPAVLIRIFLSVLNVHVNRFPYDGTLVRTAYKDGKFLDARTPESSIENESNLLVIRIPTGETIGVKQIAGKVARRIVCAIEPGTTLKRGDKFGMIKFGSTTELILPRPDDVKVHVTVGEPVRGGLTQLATMRMPARS